MGPTGRRCGVAGGERVPPALLGWYFKRKLSILDYFRFQGDCSFMMVRVEMWVEISILPVEPFTTV